MCSRIPQAVTNRPELRPPARDPLAPHQLLARPKGRYCAAASIGSCFRPVSAHQVKVPTGHPGGTRGCRRAAGRVRLGATPRTSGGAVTVPAMRLIVARCSVEYTGRSTTRLPEALRLVMLKSDGTAMVWSDTGGHKVKPLNWMTPPTVVE